MRPSELSLPSFLVASNDKWRICSDTFFNQSASKKITVKIDGYNITYFWPNGSFIQYIPEPTPMLFHQDNSLVRLIMGAYGSGKSSCCVNECVLRASKMPVCKDGVRHYGAAFIRNTYAELETTTLRTWDNWTRNCFETISRNKKPPMQVIQRFRDEKGIVEMNLLFLSLDHPDDIEKVKSLEVTDIWINEASEIPYFMISHLISRCGRYPTTQMLPDGATFNKKILMDTNPPDIDHPIYRVFEVEKPDDYKIFKQPPALLKIDGKYIANPLAENVKHHAEKENYYLDMVKGATEDFIKVYVMGDYGAIVAGEPVHPQYNDDLHSVDDITPIKEMPIKLGWDFGLTPSCLIVQKFGSQVRIIKEFCTEKSGLRQLVEKTVLPYLAENFNGYMIDSVGDPSGISGQDTDGMSCITLLHKLGLSTHVAKTNDIVKRVEAVNFFLNRIDVQPCFILSRQGCPRLRKAFLGKYGYKKIKVLGEDNPKNVPEKLHPYSDVMDCLQYICLDYTLMEELQKRKPFDPNEWINPAYRRGIL